jgi:hypothetical protein
MREITVKLVNFEELDDAGKAKAIDRYREHHDYFWFDDAMESIKAFVNRFGGTIHNYSIGEYQRSFIKTNLDAGSFRGVKLASFDREHMPTGYCLDCSLWQTFYDTFKSTGDAHHAFNIAIDEALLDVARDVEYQFSDAGIAELLIDTDMEFNEDGSLFIGEVA